MLPTNSLQSRSARAALNRLQNLHFNDARSNVNIRQALGLIWLAVNDVSYDPNAGKMKPEEKTKLLDERRKNLIPYLYEMQRGYNIDDKGFDDYNKCPNDKPICTAGHFNKLIESLKGLHPSVDIVMVTPDLIRIKALALVDNAFSALSEEDKLLYGVNWTEEEGMPTDLIEKIGNTVKNKLHEEFDEFAEEVNNYANVISEFMDNLEYNKPTRSVIAWREKREMAAQNVENAVLNAHTPVYTPAFMTNNNNIDHNNNNIDHNNNNIDRNQNWRL